MTTYQQSGERYGRTYQNNNNSNNEGSFWSTFGKIAAGGLIAAALLYKCGPDQKPQVIDNSTTIENKCCPEKKPEYKPYKPGKNNSGKKSQKTLDETVKNETITPRKSDDNCYKTIKQVLNEPCLTDPSVIYVENGVEYSYTGPGEDIKVDRKLIGKKKVHTHNFTSLDGKYDLILRQDQLNTIDQMYRTKQVKCDETISQVIPEAVKSKKSRNNEDNSNRNHDRNYYRSTAPGYSNVAVSFMAAGPNGMLAINSMPMMNPMMNMNPLMMQNYMMGFGPNYRGFTNVEVYEQTYNPGNPTSRMQAVRGSINVRNTTQPTEWQRQANAYGMYSNR
jgi:hypothetical protein